MRIFGSDVFLLKDELHGFCVSKGDRVTFCVGQRPTGVHALDVKVLMSGGIENQSLFGEVARSFDLVKGFGFISSEATEKLLGKDARCCVYDMYIYRASWHSSKHPSVGQ